MEKILSNERWFIRLVYIRNIGLTLLIIAILCIILFDNSWISTTTWWKGLAISLLMTAVIFQQLQRPAYMEIKTHNSALLIRLHIPDQRFLFFLQHDRIRTFIVHPEDEMRVHGQFGRWPWNRKVQFVVARPDGSQWRSPILDISWASEKDWQELQGLPQRLLA